MGIYDRDYYKQQEVRGLHLGGRRMMVTYLVLINVGIYLLQFLFKQDFVGDLALHQDLSWRLYQLLTYGFLHDPHDLVHILFNMFGLWFFGRDIEWKYGRQEFLSFYLTAIIFAGLTWWIVENIRAGAGASMIGASGGVMGVAVLYALNFPRRQLLVWGVLPMPAWALALVWVVMDVTGFLGNGADDRTAYIAHIGGVVFGLIYYRTHWSLGRIIPKTELLTILKRQPKLRLHDPKEGDLQMSHQVDEILRKIKLHGQDSLSKKERRLLEEASRLYQRKQR